MRLVGINSLKEGNELARPVYTSKGKIILNAGVSLSESFINKLNELNVSKVYIVDDRFSDVEISTGLDFTIRESVTKILKTIYDNVQDSKGIDEYAIKEASKKVVEYIRENKDKGVSMLSMDLINEYIIQHSINVAILTGFLGNKMSFNIMQLQDLVAGALIHDLGRKNQPNEEQEHVQTGFDAMRKLRGLSLHSSIVCYQHHENYNGTGYPRKLKENQISQYSRIIRVADYYDTILHGYNRDNISVMPHQAFEGILAVAGTVLDPEIVEKFRDTIVFYPNGCTVVLSNGTRGVVIRQNQGSPQRPVVRIIRDERNNAIEDVNLITNLTLFVEEVLIM